MLTIDYLPSREEFQKRMFTLGVWTPFNIKWYANDCPGCIRAWERRLVKRGWLDLGPHWGTGRIAPIKRMWTYYGDQYNFFWIDNHLQDGGVQIIHSAFMDCCPEQLDSYDEEGLMCHFECRGPITVLEDLGPADVQQLIEGTHPDYDITEKTEQDILDEYDWDNHDTDLKDWDKHMWEDPADWWKKSPPQDS